MIVLIIDLKMILNVTQVGNFFQIAILLNPLVVDSQLKIKLERAIKTIGFSTIWSRNQLAFVPALNHLNVASLIFSSFFSGLNDINLRSPSN